MTSLPPSWHSEDWHRAEEHRARAHGPPAPPAAGLAFLNLIFAKCFQMFSNVFGGLVLGCTERKFARKYAFDSIFQALQDVHTFAPLQF